MKETLYELFTPYLPAIWKALFAYVIVLCAVIADLWSGISKSKANGTYKRSDTSTSSRKWKKLFLPFVHTYGLDRTLDKLRKRYNLLMTISLLDSIIIISEINSHTIPYATLTAAFIMVIVEIKSIFEKDEDKGRYKEAAKTAAEFWKGVNKEELADIIIEKLDKKDKEVSNG